ncbi:multicopper oxidase family protein [Actinoplanes sp. G11-F43]|uniref:multicopper oxidase family protein n=1 Tax=Actinoplanes sp. G11-F43 TaxID=3424130 RepID=UPI003D34E87C
MAQPAESASIQDAPTASETDENTSKPRRSTRRRILKGLLIGVPAVLAASTAAGGVVYALADTDTTGKVDFDRPLTIPPLAPGRVQDGRTIFELHATAGERQLRPGPPTTTWGFDQGFLGPTIRVRRGDTVQIDVRNGLAEDTTVHWHGALLPAAMDGGPHQSIPPGQTWRPRWKVEQPAATLWYHPHPHGATTHHVNRGMAGLLLIDDDEQAAASGLPGRYGVDDVPLIVQDKNFDSGNQFDEDFSALGDVGILGDTVLVNGVPGAFFEVTTERVRLRLVNASTARVYDFGFADDREFALVGTDGGLLAAPHPTDRIRLSPGERAEIVVAFRPGEQVVLRSYPPDLGLDPLNERWTGGDDRLDIMQFRAAASLGASPVPAATLAPPAEVTLAADAVVRRFEMAGNLINNQAMDMNRIDFGVPRGTTEVWEVVSPFPRPHNFHLHGGHFQVLSVNGAPPPPELSGWKDTVYNPPEAVLRLAVTFTGHADRNTPFMYHCHLLLHEDRGMMGQFVVLEPGENPGTPAHAGHSEPPR